MLKKISIGIIMMEPELIEQGWALRPGLLIRAKFKIVQIFLRMTWTGQFGVVMSQCPCTAWLALKLWQSGDVIDAFSVCLLFLKCPTLFFKLWMERFPMCHNYVNFSDWKTPATARSRSWLLRTTRTRMPPWNWTTRSRPRHGTPPGLTSSPSKANVYYSSRVSSVA